MTVNSNNFSDTQGELFDLPFGKKFRSPAAARNEYGKVAELIAATALNLRHLKIGAYGACYDLQGFDGSFYESKSVRLGGSCPVWTWRIQKDEEVVRKFGKRVSYVFVVHDAGGADSTESLWRNMSASVKSILVVPVEAVRKIHDASSPGGIRLGTGGGGYDRPGYREGYRRVSVKEVRKACLVARPVRFPLLGHAFDLTIFTSS